MLTAEECSRLAEECEQDAGRVSSPKMSEAMLETARMWRDLAKFKQDLLRSGQGKRNAPTKVWLPHAGR